MYITNLVIYASLFMQFYELQRYYLKSLDPKKEGLAIHESVAIAFTTSILISTLINPLEVIITRFQIADSSKEILSVR